MICKIKSIELKGGYFEEIKKFDIFTEQSKSFSIIYGRNGAGKSSLSNGFYEYTTGDKRILETINILDKDGNIINHTELKDRIFVFNENFINENVAFKKSGLKSIVMFGEEKSLNEKIENVNKDIEQTRIDYLDIDKKNKHIKSQKEVIFNNIIENLKGRWSVVDKNIKGNSRKSTVTNDFINNLISISKEDKYELSELTEELNGKLNEFEKIRNENKYELIPDFNFISDSDIKLTIELLSKKILSEQENEFSRKLNDFSNRYRNGGNVFYKRVTEIMSEYNIDYCPFCLRQIDNIYKDEILSEINKILNTEEVVNFINDLKNIRSKFIILEKIYNYPKLDQSSLNFFNESIKKYNKIAKIIIEQLDSRIENIYIDFTYDKELFIDLLDNIKEVIKYKDILNVKIEHFNKLVDRSNELKEELLAINKKIAVEESRKDILSCLKIDEKLETIKNDLEEKKNHEVELKKSLNELESKKKNVYIAIDLINKYLGCVFFNKEKLKIEFENDEYIVKVDGNNVDLINLSRGEKNIIAICYFIATISNGLGVENKYSKPSLVIIDDPISSFDFDNKIGVLTLFRSFLYEFLCQDSQINKIVIFSHDLETCFHFQKVLKDIFKTSKPQIFELKNKTLYEYNQGEFNEYKNMLKDIFDYANGDTKNNMYIGNIMRRALEAFSTFVYSSGIENISTNESILSQIKEEFKKDYFRNSMYRLIVHTESHMKERAYQVNNLNFYSTITIEDKIKTAKDILIFISLLNKTHLQIYLGDECISKISFWENEIFEPLRFDTYMKKDEHLTIAE